MGYRGNWGHGRKASIYSNWRKKLWEIGTNFQSTWTLQEVVIACDIRWYYHKMHSEKNENILLNWVADARIKLGCTLSFVLSSRDYRGSGASTTNMAVKTSEAVIPTTVLISTQNKLKMDKWMSGVNRQCMLIFCGQWWRCESVKGKWKLNAKDEKMGQFPTLKLLEISPFQSQILEKQDYYRTPTQSCVLAIFLPRQARTARTVSVILLPVFCSCSHFMLDFVMDYYLRNNNSSPSSDSTYWKIVRTDIICYSSKSPGYYIATVKSQWGLKWRMIVCYLWHQWCNGRTAIGDIWCDK